MIDQATGEKLKLILAQARATKDELGEVGTLGSAHPLIRRVNSLISRAKEALKGSELEAEVPSLVSPLGDFVFGPDLRVAIASLTAGLEEMLAEEGDQAERLRAEVEDRIRKVAELGPEQYGVSLVDKALSPKGGVLRFDLPQAEQQGIHQLYRGVIAFFKNPASHRIIENYDVTRARQVVGLIDLLLQFLRDAKKKEPAKAAGASSRPLP